MTIAQLTYFTLGGGGTVNLALVTLTKMQGSTKLST